MRRFEYRDQKSAKFWEIQRDDATITTRWGRIGTQGQSTTKEYPSEAKAIAEADKQIREKTGKGYVEVGGEGELGDAAEPKADEPTPKPSKPAAKPKPSKASPAKAQAAAEPSEPAPAPSEPTATIEVVSSANEIPEGGEVTVSGSGSRTYTLRNSGGAYSCTCPAWMHQSLSVEKRTCKHLRAFRGEAAEEARIGGALPQRAVKASDGSSNAPPLLLAERWEDQDPTGWWMSEKLDGVRAYWDGSRFISRLGNAYLAPDWFIEGLPEFPLDGELFAGRGRFQHAVSVARRMDKGEGWRSLSFLIFDAPALTAGFEDRIAHLNDHFGSRPHPLASVLEHRVCKGHDDLESELTRIEELGGEGLMLRRPGSRYVAGRSDTLLKVKTFLDTEARIVGHQAGTGRHKGRLGALQVELPNGTRFKVGSGLSDAERDSPPAIGEVITVRYQELTDGGVPRFPTYVGPRADVDWDALVAGLSERGDG